MQNCRHSNIATDDTYAHPPLPSATGRLEEPLPKHSARQVDLLARVDQVLGSIYRLLPLCLQENALQEDIYLVFIGIGTITKMKQVINTLRKYIPNVTFMS